MGAARASVRSCPGHACRRSGFDLPSIAGSAQIVKHADGHTRASCLLRNFTCARAVSPLKGTSVQLHGHVLENDVGLLLQVFLDRLLNCRFGINSAELWQAAEPANPSNTRLITTARIRTSCVSNQA